MNRWLLFLYWWLIEIGCLMLGRIKLSARLTTAKATNMHVGCVCTILSYNSQKIRTDGERKTNKKKKYWRKTQNIRININPIHGSGRKQLWVTNEILQMNKYVCFLYPSLSCAKYISWTAICAVRSASQIYIFAYAPKASTLIIMCMFYYIFSLYSTFMDIPFCFHQNGNEKKNLISTFPYEKWIKKNKRRKLIVWNAFV